MQQSSSPTPCVFSDRQTSVRGYALAQCTCTIYCNTAVAYLVHVYLQNIESRAYIHVCALPCGMITCARYCCTWYTFFFCLLRAQSIRGLLQARNHERLLRLSAEVQPAAQTRVIMLRTWAWTTRAQPRLPILSFQVSK